MQLRPAPGADAPARRATPTCCPNRQVAHAIPWIVVLSQMAYYSKLYGPQVRQLRLI